MIFGVVLRIFKPKYILIIIIKTLRMFLIRALHPRARSRTEALPLHRTHPHSHDIVLHIMHDRRTPLLILQYSLPLLPRAIFNASRERNILDIRHPTEMVVEGQSQEVIDPRLLATMSEASLSNPILEVDELTGTEVNLVPVVPGVPCVYSLWAHKSEVQSLDLRVVKT